MKIPLSIAFLVLSAPLFSQSTGNVLLVVNDTSAVSIEVGSYYAQKRGVPQSNFLKISVPDQESIGRGDFEKKIETPIASWLKKNSAQDRILYIVLTKGIPIRVSGTSGKEGSEASVDSELTLLYRKLLGQPINPAGPIRNPYFLGIEPLGTAKPFNHADYDIYLVSRLDGYTGADIRALIDRGAAPSTTGKILLDMKGTPAQKGDIWLEQSAEMLSGIGLNDRVILEKSSKILTGEKEVLGYYSWGSSDPAIRIRQFGFGFVPGALSGMFVSSDGRTFQDSGDWKIGESGSPQSLAADLIRDGITGIAAHVSEPFLEGAVRPNILFPAYLSGFNLIESYYLSMPFISWQTVVIGDPLCAPFRKTSISSSQIDKGIDPVTELPLDFSRRRVRETALRAFKESGVRPETVKAILRSEVRIAKGDYEGAREALEAAVTSDERLPAPQLQLAQIYEQLGDYDKAVERYRKLYALAPNNALILNNLSYVLAVRKNQVQEALPMAEKAYSLTNGNATTSDTLGWIYHLAGQEEKALKLLSDAAAATPRRAEVHLHLAIVSAATGDKASAETALKRALEIKPELVQDEEVVRLRTQLR